MITHTASPQDWLTDSGLTNDGQIARKAYSKFVNYMHSLPVPLYRTSRALHLLQSVEYDTNAEGYSLPPHTINFCVNNRCNLRCSYCDLSHGRAEEEGSKNTKVLHNVIDPHTKFELPLRSEERRVGKEYLDFESGCWSTALGHSHPRINQVMEAQIKIGRAHV